MAFQLEVAFKAKFYQENVLIEHSYSVKTMITRPDELGYLDQGLVCLNRAQKRFINSESI